MHIRLVLSVMLLLSGWSGLRLEARGLNHPPEQARALEWLHTQQLPDGGFGGPPGTPGAQSDAGSTAEVIYVLALLGEDSGVYAWRVNGKSPLDALAVLAPAYVRVDAGQAGKVVRAVTRAGKDPHSFAGMDLVQVIVQAYNAGSGRYHPELQFRHSIALEAADLAGLEVPPAALDAMLATQRPDGGWFWAFSGASPDVDSTGRIMQTLAVHGNLRCAPVLLPSVHYLIREHKADGWDVGEPDGPPNANSTALALAGLQAYGYNLNALAVEGAGRGPREELLDFQEASGAFVYTRQAGKEGSRLAATLDALLALRGAEDARLPCRVKYLPIPQLSDH